MGDKNDGWVWTDPHGNLRPIPYVESSEQYPAVTIHNKIKSERENVKKGGQIWIFRSC